VSATTPEQARAQYPVFQRIAYLNAGSVGPLAQSTHDAIQARQRDALTRGRGSTAAHADYQDLMDAAVAMTATAIGVRADRVVLTASTTEGCNIVLGAMRLGPGDQVVTTDNEHPGLTAPLAASGVELRVARVVDRPASEALQAILEQVTPTTRLIAMSHVGWLNGQILPISEVKRATGLPVLVDGAQATGAIPVDAEPVDFYTVSCQKWLCGPETTGALYIREPERWTPRLAGYSASHAEGIDRYRIIHHSVATLAGLRAALESHPQWRHQRAAEMTERCRTMLSKRHHVISEPGQGTLLSVVAPGDPEACVTRALDQGVVIRSLPDRPWLRVSCGYWTSDDDLERLARALNRS
jgi:L-cysteine/cystine lyase